MTDRAVRCREITEADRNGVITLLTAGFRAQRRRRYWVRAMARLGSRAIPEGVPRFGYLLESAGTVVGVILLIFSPVEGTDRTRCNVSSWWVQPDFRLFGALLVARAFRHQATYTNITPAPQTLPILEAQGYTRYCRGRVVAASWLARDRDTCSVARFHPGMQPGLGLTEAHLQLLRDHTAFGCISVVCTTEDGRYPFVFAPRRRLGVIGLAVLTYCASEADFPRFAGALGRFLLRRGCSLVVLDADAPIPGLGRYYPDRPKFFRGPDRPRIGDQAYSERAIIGS